MTPPEGPPENELNPMLGLGSGRGGGIMPFFTHTPQTSKRPTKTKPKKGEGVEEEKSENLALGYTEDTSSTPGPAVDYTTGEPDYKFKGKKGQKVENLGCRT